MTEDEFLTFFRERRVNHVRYGARLLRGKGANPYSAMVDAESIYNLVMTKYHAVKEHLDDNANHEANIRRRIQQAVVDEARRQLAKARKPPQPLASLDAPIPNRSGNGSFVPDPADESSGDPQLEVDLTDRLSRLPERDRQAAEAKDAGHTNQAIGEQLGVSEESARQAALRAGKALRDDK